VLVRMKGDKFGSKRTNWLLIKHRDGTEHEGDGDALLADAPSIASGRPMEDIEAGRGKGATPFITKAKSATTGKGDEVWQSNRAQGGPAPEPPPTAIEKLKPRKAKALKAAGLPGFVESQLCRSVDRPPPGAGWAPEIKFDGYRMQLRVEGG